MELYGKTGGLKMDLDVQIEKSGVQNPVKTRHKASVRVNFRLDPERAYVLDKVIAPALGGSRTYALEWLIDNYKAVTDARDLVQAFRDKAAAEKKLAGCLI